MMKNLTIKNKLHNRVQNGSEWTSKTTFVLPYVVTYTKGTLEDWG